MALRKTIIKMIVTRKPIHRFSKRVVSTEAASKEKQERQTHFGFQSVDEEEKWKKGVIINGTKMVGFPSYCGSYNHLLS